MKKLLCIFFSIVLVMGLMLTGCADTSDQDGDADNGEGPPEGIKIGVSIWSSTDTLGSEVKTILDAAADALDVELVYVDQGHVSEQVTGSVETLAAADVDGIIICNSSSAEMTSVINTADQYEVYVSQFFRFIDPELNPDEYALAQSSPYYVGAVHEDEVENGRNLIQILADQGSRKIAVMGWEAGDATFLGRLEGYEQGVAEWNAENPDDPIELLDTQYGGTTSDTGRSTAESIISANPDIDGFIAAGGGGDPLIGAIEAIEAMGRTGEIRLVSTDFLPDLDAKLESGEIAGQSGGHYADPLFAFMMVYNAITGNWDVPEDDFHVVHFPYMYVASPEDYAEYEDFFVERLPYSDEEFVEMSTMSFQELYDTAARLSIEDVKARHGD